MSAPACHVLIVDDEAPFRALLRDELRTEGHEVVDVGDAAAALEALARRDFDVVLLDLRLGGDSGLDLLPDIVAMQPAPEVIMLTGHGTMDTAIQAMKLGAYDFLTKPCNLSELDVLLSKAHEHRRLRRENEALRTLVGGEGTVETLRGSSPSFRRVVDMALRVAPSTAPVLIQGESGTGKELIAQLIHHESERASQPFIPINCGALQEQLLASELFGHERGAFTGATARKYGLFEVASGGTLFLDEVGEMAPSVQVTLLRTLETGELRRLGSNTSKRVDVRIISATNRDLKRCVRDGTFREDLYYRLNTVELWVPPLRERPEDIRELVEHFLRRASHGHNIREVDAAVWRAFLAYDWPGNVRELRSVVERAVLLCPGPTLSPADLPYLALGGSKPARDAAADPETPLADVERRHILGVLRHCGGNKTQAAKILGITPKTLYNKLQAYQRDGR